MSDPRKRPEAAAAVIQAVADAAHHCPRCGLVAPGPCPAEPDGDR